MRVVVSEIERENGDIEHTYAHLPYGSTPGENEELVTVVREKVVRRDETSGVEAGNQKVRRRQPPAAASKSSERSARESEHDSESKWTWKLGGFSLNRKPRRRQDDATLQQDTSVTQATSDFSNDPPTAPRSRRRTGFPSSTTKVDSAITTQKTTSRQRQTKASAAPSSTPTPVPSSLEQIGGTRSSLTNSVTTIETHSLPNSNTSTSPAILDGSQGPARSRTMFQQPGMTCRQSNAFVFDPAPQKSPQSRSSHATNASVVTMSVPGSKIATSAKPQTSTSPSLLEFTQVQTQMLAQLPPQAQAYMEARQTQYKSKLAQLPHELQAQAHAQMGAEIQARTKAQLNSVG